MNTTQKGNAAENLVASELKSQGYKINAQNWRTRWCEIDIIASKSRVMYFIEVKYRKNTAWGDGFDAITSKKQKQMAFAAEFWVLENNWAHQYLLAAASVSSEPPKLQQFIVLD